MSKIDSNSQRWHRQQQDREQIAPDYYRVEVDAAGDPVFIDPRQESGKRQVDARRKASDRAKRKANRRRVRR